MQLYRSRNRGSDEFNASFKVTQLLIFQGKTIQQERSEPVGRGMRKRKRKVCPDLTSLTVNRKKEPLKDVEDRLHLEDSQEASAKRENFLVLRYL